MKTANKRIYHVTEVINHDIKWWIESDKIDSLDESTIEHLEYMIGQGFTSGELNVSYGENLDKETNGWWEIINWKSIALEFYNCMGDIKGELPKSFIHAKERFNENWF